MMIKYTNINSFFLALIIILSFTFCACNQQITYDWHIVELGLGNVWSKYTGTGVKVAVIDSGLNYELTKDGIDEERILKKYNAFDRSDDVTDGTGHGSAMACLIGSDGDNGIYGVAPDCKFVIIKALNEKGGTTSEILAISINYAVQSDVDVINLSLGGKTYDAAVEQAIVEAYKKNIAVICAVGDNDEDEAYYPARLDYTLGVAAVDFNGKAYMFSNTGEGVDVYVPGVRILVPQYDLYGEYVIRPKSGSSVATAIATGLFALIAEADNNYSIEKIFDTFCGSESIDLYNFINF